tara:strand:+ start:615 stop:2297 length:1683 start_codon:yes stop_codon:yes gene_type:complete
MDPFMGGGVSIYEGLQISRKVVGFDLNPLSTFIVHSMLATDVDFSKLHESYRKVNSYINNLEQLYYLGDSEEKSMDIMWSELTHKVICNLCLGKTYLSNDLKIAPAKYLCINKTCPSNSQDGIFLRPTNCERIGIKYLSAIVKDQQKQIQKIFYDSNDLKRLSKYLDMLRRLLKQKDVKITQTEIPMNWDRQLEDKLFSKGVKNFEDFFTTKNLLLNLLLKRCINELQVSVKVKFFLRLVFSSSLRDTNLMSFTNEGWQSGKPTTWSKHAFWLPSQFCEVSVSDAFQRAYKRLISGLRHNQKTGLKVNLGKKFQDIQKGSNTILIEGSIDTFDIPSCSVDLVVTDPPYGSNVQYLELSHFWYPWNKDLYANPNEPKFADEAVSNRKSGFLGAKDLTDYENNLTKVFAKTYDCLKYDKPMVLTFNNKNMGAWLALLFSIFRAGFNLDISNMVFQDGVENYRQTAHSKFKGSEFGDFVYTFFKEKNNKKEEPITVDMFIQQLDKIFISPNLNYQDDLITKKIEQLRKSIPYIKRYILSPYLVQDRELIFKHFDKNYFKRTHV